ncbi:MAG: hypothetical protein R3C14_00260 [Caldilineaceae bacterium]
MLSSIILSIPLFFAAFAPFTHANPATRSQNSQPIIYGASNLIGPALEPCATENTTSNAVVLAPTSDWQQYLTKTAKPGETILLHGGVYQANKKLWIAAGAAEQPITIKPYGCEEVTLLAGLRLASYTVVAGLTIEAAEAQWVIQIDSNDDVGSIQEVALQNNNLRGGTIDAVRISDDVVNVRITGNHIDGGEGGHDIFVAQNKTTYQPNHIYITNNRLTKSFFKGPAEDMLQVRGVGYVEFTGNTCTDGYDMEQCVDIKTTSAPMLIANNFFDGDHLHLAGKGEDGAGGCMVIHEAVGTTSQHVIEHNFFDHCKDSIIRFGADSSPVTSNGIIRYNLFDQTGQPNSLMQIQRATSLEFVNNTFICGHFKLGHSNEQDIPQSTLIKQNIFYQVDLEDHVSTANSGATYTCPTNIFFGATGNFRPEHCPNSSASDPHFVNMLSQNYYLMPDSPALGTGESGVDLGAYSAWTYNASAPTYAFQLFLPVASAPEPVTFTCN